MNLKDLLADLNGMSDEELKVALDNIRKNRRLKPAAKVTKTVDEAKAKRTKTKQQLLIEELTADVRAEDL